VFSYEGSPSWVLITVGAQYRAGLTAAKLVMDDGSQVPLQWFHLDAGGGSGGAIPVDPQHVSVLRLAAGNGAQVLVAKF